MEIYKELRYNFDIESEKRTGMENWKSGGKNMSEYAYITLRQSSQFKKQAATWFHNK